MCFYSLLALIESILSMNQKQMYLKKHLGILGWMCLTALLLPLQTTAQITVDFTYTDSVGCGSVPVSFCDNSTSTAGAIVSWTWDLGGANVNIECPSRIFGNPGKYSICLTVTDDQNNSASKCKNEFIQVLALPQPDFDADIKEGCVPIEVSFDDNSISKDGNITDWLWGLGGSCGTVTGNGSSPAAVCTYDVANNYNISLTITDDNGCTNTIVKSDFIKALEIPTIDIPTTAQFGCDPPYTASFTNDSPTSNINFRWDFGNGDTYSGVTPPPIVYNSYGCHTVTVIAQNIITGCSDTLELDNAVCIGNTVDFSVSTEDVCQDATVLFTDESLIGADSVRWTFGDGTTSSAANPGHIYTSPGCYTVTLERFLGNCSSIFQYANCINVNTPPNVTYNNNNSVGCSLPHIVNFAGIPQTSDIVSWSWDFGDGQAASTQNPVHNYTDYGNYIVTLTVTNSDGCTFEYSNNPIVVLELVSEIVSPVQTGCIPLDVTLIESSMSIAPISTWNWSIQTGSGTYTSTDEQAMITIPDTGVFDVVLIVINNLGCSDTIVAEDLIVAGMQPVIDFEASTLEECIEVPIDFTDLSSDYAETWEWKFGDGEESFSQNTFHEYQDTGFYNVTLIASHNGCENSLTKPTYIHIKEPLAKFNTVQYCEDIFRVDFIDRSVGAHTVFWDFGVLSSTTDTSSQRSPIFNFPAPGVYTVTQTAFNASTNCQHSTSKDITISDPTAAFSFSPGSGCSPVTLAIQDLSDWAASWEWTAPGGSISNYLAPEPDITYDTPGAYSDIQLIITDVNGCKDTLLNTNDTVYVNAIDVDFSYTPDNGCGPLEVNFTDLSTN